MTRGWIIIPNILQTENSWPSAATAMAGSKSSFPQGAGGYRHSIPFIPRAIALRPGTQTARVFWLPLVEIISGNIPNDRFGWPQRLIRVTNFSSMPAQNRRPSRPMATKYSSFEREPLGGEKVIGGANQGNYGSTTPCRLNTCGSCRHPGAFALLSGAQMARPSITSLLRVVPSTSGNIHSAPRLSRNSRPLKTTLLSLPASPATERRLPFGTCLISIRFRRAYTKTRN